MYVKLFPRDLNSTLTSISHKHLYLWSDHHIKGVQWCSCIIFIIWESSSCIKWAFRYASVYVFAGVWHFVWVLCSIYGTYKPLFLVKFSLKMGLTILFTHLKIILLQYFQFSIISDIQIELNCSKHNHNIACNWKTTFAFTTEFYRLVVKNIFKKRNNMSTTILQK